MGLMREYDGNGGCGERRCRKEGCDEMGCRKGGCGRLLGMECVEREGVGTSCAHIHVGTFLGPQPDMCGNRM